MFSKSYYFVCNACGHRNKWLHNGWSLFNRAVSTWLHCPPLLWGLFIRGEPARLPGLAWLMPFCCLIKCALFLYEKAGWPACQDPGCSSRDLDKRWANQWPSSRGPFTKIYGGRKQTSNDENFCLFLIIDKALRRPNYYHWHSSHSRVCKLQDRLIWPMVLFQGRI